MPEPSMATLRVGLARRVGRDLTVMGGGACLIAGWQMHRGPWLLQASIAGDSIAIGLCAFAFLTPSRRLPAPLVLAALIALSAITALAVGFGPAVGGVAAIASLLTAFLVGSRAALAIGLSIELLLVAIGALHAAFPGVLAHTSYVLDPSVASNWVRAFFVLLPIMAVSIPAMLGHLQALGDATHESRALAAAALEEERRRAEVAAARAHAEAERRELAGLHVLDMVGAGFAQRCGNLLQAIGTEIDLLNARPRAVLGADRVSEGLQDMGDAVKASAAVLRRLVALSQGDAPGAAEPLPLGEFARAALRQLGKIDGVEVVVRVKDPVVALGDPAALHGVLLNLALNARDAMPSGGTLTLTARAATSDELRESGCRAALDVADTGSGMDEATLARAFEPFFTTKGAGGTGMGLHAARRVLEALGGRLTATSARGVGTTFTLLLREAPEAPAVQRQSAVEPTRVGSRVPVLIVDDEPAVRRGWRMALRERGFVVIEAEDADAALKAASEHRIALAWMDAAMRGRPTRSLIDELRRTQPDAHLVVCSALLEQELERRDLRSAGVELVGKPCSLETFLEHAERAARAHRGEARARLEGER